MMVAACSRNISRSRARQSKCEDSRDTDEAHEACVLVYVYDKNLQKIMDARFSSYLIWENGCNCTENNNFIIEMH